MNALSDPRFGWELFKLTLQQKREDCWFKRAREENEGFQEKMEAITSALWLFHRNQQDLPL